MDILFVAAELAPFVKVGGLADVVAALGKAVRQLGHKVTVALPRYPGFEQGGLLMARRLTPLAFELGGVPIEVTVYDGRLPSGVEISLFDAPGLFNRDGVYGDADGDYADNAHRFAVLSRAAAELVRQREALGTPFDVVHLHDWPAALVPVYLRGDGGRHTPTLLTVHNLAHQGPFSAEVAASIGLPRVAGSFLAAGLEAAGRVTTVSDGYAREIQTAEQGAGLDAVIARRAGDLVGITNGVDHATWNPATDPTLVARYDAEDASGKERCKAAVLRELGLEVAEGRPLVISVGRMVQQKGTDLVASAMQKIVRAGATVVVAGDGEPKLVVAIEKAVAKCPGEARFVRAAPEALVHRLFAGADLALVPSRFEPCGLVQLYAQRYGAAPVARATGGLRDTVVDCDAALSTGTGFLFDEPTATALVGAVQRALSAYASPSWRVLRRRMMKLDLGWDRPARRYTRLYQSLVGGT